MFILGTKTNNMKKKLIIMYSILGLAIIFLIAGLIFYYVYKDTIEEITSLNFAYDMEVLFKGTGVKPDTSELDAKSDVYKVFLILSFVLSGISFTVYSVLQSLEIKRVISEKKNS